MASKNASFYENEVKVNNVEKITDGEGKAKRVLLKLENNDITKNLFSAIKIFIEGYELKLRN